MANKMKISKILIILAALFLAQMYLASALTISSVTSSPTQIQPGQQVSLDLTIKNDLNNDVNNVVVSLDLNNPANPIPFAPYQSSNQRTIDSISDDEKVHFELIALSNAASGTYTIPVKMTHDNLTTSETGLISITINAKPNIVISSVGSALIRGQNGKITLQIVNSGLGISNFLNIDLESAAGISIISTNNVYIGNINSNDFDTADFNVFVNSNAHSIISLPVEVTYKDSQNNQIIQDSIVLIKTYTPQEAKNLGLISKSNSSLIIILIVAVIIIFFIYKSVRKRRRNKLNGK